MNFSRSFILAALLLQVTLCAYSPFPTFQLRSDHFGRRIAVRETQGLVETKIYDKEIKFEHGSPQHEAMVDLSLQARKKSLETIKKGDKPTISQCDHTAGFFKFGGTNVAVMKTAGEKKTTESFCFKTVNSWYTQTTADTITITVKSSGHKKLFCSDSYLITIGQHFHMLTVAFPGTHKVTFHKMTATDTKIVQGNGAKLIRFCDTKGHFIKDLISTVMLFGAVGGSANPSKPWPLGSKVPKKIQEKNVEFIKQTTGYQWEPRNPVNVPLDASYIKSGDVFGITRFDGLDNIIHWGAGSMTGHTTMALWDHTSGSEQLWVVESQNAAYWPTKGIQKTKYEDWVKQAQNADYNVVHFPLRKEYADKFDEAKAWAWFKRTDGLPYGFKNFIFGWIDTPDKNMPDILDLDFVIAVASHLENIPILGKFIDFVVQEGFNWRLGTKGLKLNEMWEKMAEKKTSFTELAAIVEKDYIEYSDGYNYVCSSYVVSMHKQAGIFGDFAETINPGEFTPKDVYIMDIFDVKSPRPEACQKADPELQLCQMMGSWKMAITEVSTVKPYPHMFEKCPTQAPEYSRPAGC